MCHIGSMSETSLSNGISYSNQIHDDDRVISEEELNFDFS